MPSKKSSSSELITAEELKTCLLKVLDSDEVLAAIVQKLNNQLTSMIEKKMKNLQTAFEAKCKDQNEKISNLMVKVEEASAANSLLSNKINKLEQDKLRNSLILKGCNFAKTLADKTNPTFSPDPQSIVDFCKSELEIEVSANDVKFARRILTKSGDTSASSFLVSFNNISVRDAIFKSRLKLKGRSIYINEHLTQQNALLMFEARKLKKQKRISDCYTHFGTPTVKVNGKIHSIHSKFDLEKFL